MKRTYLIFYFLSAYVLLQFVWWAYQLIQLNLLIDASFDNQRRIISMIVGEGTVFLLILCVGLWQIRRAIKNEINLSTRQSNFLLSVTHELKTPLATNKLAFQTLLKRDLEKPQKDILIEKALIETHRLEVLIDNFLNASRIENKAMAPELAHQNLNDLILPIVDSLLKTHPERTIKTTFKKEITAQIDQYMIHVVLYNLLENALKYSSKESLVELIAEEKHDQICIEVKDEGRGVEKGEEALIFEKFFRSGNEYTREKKGSGIGLYIAREFIKLHKGRLEYRANVPKGSVFVITLPQ